MASNEQRRKAKQLTDSKRLRDAAREAESAALDLEVTEPGAWKGRVQTGRKLLLPSGNVCLARNPGIEPFISEGLIPNALMPIVMSAIRDGKGVPDKALKEMLDDDEIIYDIIKLTNTVALRCVLRPTIHAAPVWTERDVEEGSCSEDDLGAPSPQKRKADVLYVDDVDMTDKMFVFQWVVGGTHDLEQFRSQSAASLANLAAVEGVEQEAE